MVQKYSHDGSKLLLQIGNQAHGIAVDYKGNVYIAENRGRRVHKFSPNTASSQRSRASGG